MESTRISTRGTIATIEQVRANQVALHHDGLEDRIVAPADLAFKHETGVRNAWIELPDTGFGYSVAGRPFAQLCSRLNMPAIYVRRLPADIQARLLDFGVKEYCANRRGKTPPPFMLRVDNSDGRIRAVLSHRFTPLDNIPVLDALFDAITLGALGADEMTAFASRENTDGFRVNFCGGETVVDPVGGEKLRLGLSIANSEIGASSVSVAPFAFRSYCSNGMIFGYRALEGDSRVRHLGGDPGHLRAWFMEACGRALGSLDHIAGRVREAIGTPVADPDKYIDGASHWLALSKEDREAIHSTANAERMDHGRADFCVYDIVNGITNRAKVKSPERREYYERIGAAIIEGIIKPESPPRGRRSAEVAELLEVSEN